MKRTIILFLINIIGFLTFSQEIITLRIRTNLNNKEIVLGEHLSIGDSMVTITALKFYVTAIDEKDHSTVHLIDYSDATSFSIRNSIPSNLFLGTDSLTNVSGIIEGDLDPIHGMYWAWNSGYINFKLEGFWNDNPQQQFEYHIGGYRSPYSTLRKIGSHKNSSQEMLVDLNPIFDYIMQQNIASVMNPGKNALLFCNQLISCFELE